MALGLGGTIENQTSQTVGSMGKKIRIEACNATSGNVVIRNVGTENINIDTELSFIVGSSPVTPTGCSGSLAPGGVTTCEDVGINSGQKLIVSAPGNSDEITCE